MFTLKMKVNRRIRKNKRQLRRNDKAVGKMLRHSDRLSADLDQLTRIRKGM